MNSIFLKNCEFVAGYVEIDSLPGTEFPEIAFAGRSNVGKSSLINTLTGRRTLVKTSSTPGRTQELNFFLLAASMMLVDMPGYGYAKAPRKEVARWTLLVKRYLTGRPNLRRVCLMIDARHGIKEIDQDIMSVLDEAAVNYQIILTKSDKIKPLQLTQLMEKSGEILKKHAAAHPMIIATSSETKAGIDALREELTQFV